MKTSIVYKNHLWFIVAIAALLTVSCSSEKKTLVSRSYHNLTAHFNAYFLANERMKEIEAAYWDGYQDNYNDILRIFPVVDTVTASSVSEPLEDCIKKASLAIQNHKNSKWVDDSYVLVGKARYYDADFVNAIETFKFVNINSEDNNTRHEALVFLMRTFVDYQEHNNAIAVSDFLKKEKLNKNNLKSLYLTRAYLFQQKEDYSNMVKNLALAAPLLSKEDKPARVHFIIGQVFQKLGFESLAYENYRETLKNNPEYELSFYARLNMAQVFELADSKDVSKARKFFKKLLKDSKNIDFRDKIYYEMAEFEKKQGNQDLAITYYKNSAKASRNNNRQKSYAFLRLGQIYYDEMGDYELAKAYYDSTIAVMPDDEPEYLSIKKRQEILADFVTQLNTIALQDSLLQMAQLDTASLLAIADEQFMLQQEQMKQQERESLRRTSVANNQENPFAGAETSGSGSNWYFYNPASISVGQAEFRRKWGNRPLQDNWRRSEALRNVRRNDAEEEEEALAQRELAVVDVQEQKSNFRKAFLSSIPFSEEQKEEAHRKLEEAYYTLGNIYNFNLLERENSRATFLTLLKRYPETSYEPEVLYLLYLIGGDLGDPETEKYKKTLLDQFPNSSYAKTIINPNYKQESEALSAELQRLYAVAFRHYQNEAYKAADSLLQIGLNEYASNAFTDNLSMLKILIIGKTENITSYQFALEQFLVKYPESDLIPFAQKLLDSSRKFETSQLKGRGINSFIDNLDQEHLFVVVYNKNSALSNVLPQALDTLSKNNFEELALKSGNMNFNEEKGMVMVDNFKNKKDALDYLRLFKGNEALKNEDNPETLQEFVITKDNFQILYKTKDINSYVSFYEKHY